MTRNDRVLEYQRALANFAKIAAEATRERQLLDHAAATISAVTRVRHVTLMKYRAAEGNLLIVAGVGWKPGVVGHTCLGIDPESPAGYSIQTGEPLVIQDLPNDPYFRYSGFLREHNIVSAAHVPVGCDGYIWGVLEVDSENPRTFDEIDVGLLTAYANMLNLALQRLTMANELRAKTGAFEQEKSYHNTVVQEQAHRFRNNLQLIAGVLMRESRQGGPETQAVLKKTMSHVQAISLAHDQLSARGDEEVDLGTYLTSLSAAIDPRRSNITFEVDVTPCKLALDRTVVIGLIVNELITNTLKHGLPDRDGTIGLRFVTHGDRGEGVLTVEDDGRGMGNAAVNGTRQGGMGTQLIEAFALQIGGKITRETPERGARVVLSFPLLTKPEDRA